MMYNEFDNNNNDITNPPPMPMPPLKPSNWVWQAVLVTLCCLPVFGVVGLVYGLQVNPNYYAGNYERAERMASRARMWTLIGLVVGIIYIIFSVVVLMRGDLLSEITQMRDDGAYSIYNY